MTLYPYFLTFLFHFDAVQDMRCLNKKTVSVVKVGIVKAILSL